MQSLHSPSARLESIRIEGDPLMGLPVYVGGEGSCSGCLKCVTVCPGLAITLVDYRKDREFPDVTVPYEVANFPVRRGTRSRRWTSTARRSAR